MKFLIVVDMQRDFINGALGSPHAESIVAGVVAKVKSFSGEVIFTRDTHFEGYLETQEGKKLPVVHCVKGTSGWEICDELAPYATKVIDKITFGSVDLPDVLRGYGEDVEEIELCGLCTDICVISNAMILKSAFPEARITVDGKCSAGVTVESHNTALAAMRCVQIDVI
ncbi:MAG: cysteine hydrolase [Clostridia bacterium]|nr:cysteine hydrolase [Clostridia bacterium]